MNGRGEQRKRKDEVREREQENVVGIAGMEAPLEDWGDMVCILQPLLEDEDFNGLGTLLASRDYFLASCIGRQDHGFLL